MNETKFTSGPWEVLEIKGVLIMPSDPHRGCVAECYRNVGPLDEPEQVEANAHLITASPLLFQFAEQKAAHGDPWAQEIVKAITSGEDTTGLWR